MIVQYFDWLKSYGIAKCGSEFLRRMSRSVCLTMHVSMPVNRIFIFPLRFSSHQVLAPQVPTAPALVDKNHTAEICINDVWKVASFLSGAA